MIKKQGIWICVVTLPVLVLGKHLGLSLLSMIYGVDLNSYWKEFLVLLLAGGLNAMTQSLTSVITAMRYARSIWNNGSFQFICRCTGYATYLFCSIYQENIKGERGDLL